MGKIIENYSLQSELGRGVYSCVYKAINTITKQEVAIKMVKADKFKELPKLEEGTVNQINILSNLEYCPHIIRYYDMLKTVNNFYFVYEYCNGGTLESMLKKSAPLPQKAALGYFSQILEAFKILSKHNIMHRDLKPQNLLLHDGIIKLADFGFCKPMEHQDETTQTMLGSPIYMAPEILKGETYSLKADVWSLGVVMFRMLYGKCPFESSSIGKLIIKIEEEELVIPDKPEISPKVVQLLQRMIRKDPRERADWSEVFSFNIRSTSIINSFCSGKNSNDSGMKNSFTPSESTNTPTTGRQEFYHPMPRSSRGLAANSTFNFDSKLREEKKANETSTLINSSNSRRDRLAPEINSSFNTKGKLRNTYASKSPIRDNVKKEMLIKNHQKCGEIFAFTLHLAKYQIPQSHSLSYIFAKSCERELNLLKSSIKKEFDTNLIEENFLNTFNCIIDEEILANQRILKMYEQFQTEQWTINIIHRKKQLLKEFVNRLRLESYQELVTTSRLIDYVEDSILIKRETYQKMSRDQLIKQIRHKMQALGQTY